MFDNVHQDIDEDFLGKIIKYKGNATLHADKPL